MKNKNITIPDTKTLRKQLEDTRDRALLALSIINDVFCGVNAVSDTDILNQYFGVEDDLENTMIELGLLAGREVVGVFGTSVSEIIINYLGREK